MTPSRREFLMRSFATGLGLVLPTRLAAQMRTARGDSLAAGLSYHAPTVAAYIDTLLPDDGVTPAASALGVDTEVSAFLASTPQVGDAALLMCDWLDKPGPIRFAMRSERQRLEIMDLLATAPQSTLEGWFYSTLRLLAIEFYYAKPEALVGLNLSAAPQPEGYLPPWA
jgi:hypothetical protein